MFEIIKGVNNLSVDELTRANKEHPLFHSDHEAMGVIEEETRETCLEAVRMIGALTNFKRSVFADREDFKKIDDIKKLRKAAMMCAGEAIQTVAMCDKYFMGKAVDEHE